MTIPDVTGNDQITPAKELPENLVGGPDNRIKAEMLPASRNEIHASTPFGSTDEAFNLLKHGQTPTLDIDDINRITADGWATVR